jgi:hypothetical protein
VATRRRALASAGAFAAGALLPDIASAKLASAGRFSAPHAPRAPLLGFHDEFRTRPLLAAVAGVARVTSPVRPSDPSFKALVQVLDVAAFAGSGVLLAPYTDGSAEPPSPEEFGEAVSVALRCAGPECGEGVARVTGIEVWNEPNIPEFGALPPDYVATLCRAALEARTDPSVPVIAGGVFCGGEHWQEYLAQLRDLTPSEVDLAVHAYAFDTRPRRVLERCLASLREARGIAGSRGLWLTEYGFNSEGEWQSERTQRASAKAVVREAWKLRLRGVIYYRLMDDTGDQFYGYGAVREDGTPKAAYSCLARQRPFRV